MAIILCLETATTNCSVSVFDNGQLLGFLEENSKNYTHAEKLHVLIAEVLQRSSLQFSDLKAVAVSKGPGSYTGLRIGVSAAKGLCFALKIPLISISTLESLARQLKVQNSDLIIPLLDARRMEVYSAVFDSLYRCVRPVKAQIITAGSFHQYAASSKLHLIGDGATKCKEVLALTNTVYYEGAFPSSKDMGGMAYEKYQKGDFENIAYFEPYYLKDFIAGKKKKPNSF